MMNTELIAEQFSKASSTYDSWATPQTTVAKRMCSFLPQRATQILDVGCGTGIMAQLLKDAYPTAYLTCVDPAPGMIQQCSSRFAHDTNTSCIISSAEEFCSPHRFDLVVSTNSFHWFSDKRKALANIHRSLTSSGVFLIATPLRRTLLELYESCLNATGNSIHCIDLFSEEEHTSVFLEYGLRSKTIIVEEFQQTVSSPLDIIHLLQAIGGAPPLLRHDSLLPKEQMQQLEDYYTNHFSVPGGVRVTYQFLYGVYTPA